MGKEQFQTVHIINKQLFDCSCSFFLHNAKRKFLKFLLQRYPQPKQCVICGFMLGELFMALGLANEWKGQFFTPYDICRAMAAMNLGEDLKSQIEEKGWVSVSDKTTPRLIQFHTLKNAANPPFLGGFSIFGTVAA